jgi:hypothetical protein
VITVVLPSFFQKFVENEYWKHPQSDVSVMSPQTNKNHKKALTIGTTIALRDGLLAVKACSWLKMTNAKIASTILATTIKLSRKSRDGTILNICQQKK